MLRKNGGDRKFKKSCDVSFRSRPNVNLFPEVLDYCGKSMVKISLKSDVVMEFFQ